jgi:hypothetical protein
VLVLGGKPFGEQIVMWWNFIGPSHEEVVAFREEWLRQRADRTPGAPGRYGAFPDVWEHTLPAPEPPVLGTCPGAPTHTGALADCRRHALPNLAALDQAAPLRDAGRLL